MSEKCTIGGLGGSSKIGLGATIALIVAFAGISGFFIGNFTQAPPSHTRVNIAVDEGFYVEFKDGNTILVPADPSYNCSILQQFTLQFNTHSFDKLMGYMASHPSYDFDPTTATDLVGDDFVMTGIQETILSKYYLSTGTASDLERLDGKSAVVDNGENVLLLSLSVGTYDGGVLKQCAFSFKDNNNFVGCIGNGTANYNVFNNTTFVRGDHNDLTIHGMVLDENTIVNSILLVTLNTINYTMQYSTIF